MNVPIEHLPPLAVEGHHPASAPGGRDHPMRLVTRRAAGLDPGGWTSELRNDVRKYFDDLAPEWQARDTTTRVAIVRDALSRGLRPAASRGLAIEIGSGTGSYSGLIADRFSAVVAVDLSLAMLRLAPERPAHRVQADGARLPLRDSSAAGIVLINAFLFPSEAARVLTPDGELVWVNSSGEQTPIYLSPDDLLARLPGRWTGVASRAGQGHWCVVRRARS